MLWTLYLKKKKKSKTKIAFCDHKALILTNYWPEINVLKRTSSCFPLSNVENFSQSSQISRTETLEFLICTPWLCILVTYSRLPMAPLRPGPCWTWWSCFYPTPGLREEDPAYPYSSPQAWSLVSPHMSMVISHKNWTKERKIDVLNLEQCHNYWDFSWVCLPRLVADHPNVETVPGLRIWAEPTSVPRKKGTYCLLFRSA